MSTTGRRTPLRRRLVPVALAALLASGRAGSTDRATDGGSVTDRLTIALPATVGGPLNPFVTFTEQVSELVYDKLLLIGSALRLQVPEPAP